MNERQTKILDLLTKSKKIEVAKLSELLNVSQVTIRKDLVQLESSGIIIREHGYATINDSDDMNTRLAYHYENKQKIAKKAAELVNNGETVMIESGSCCALLALELVQTKRDITIITNSAFIADYVRKSGNVKIILLGGEYQNESQVMVGPITRKCVETFFVDKLFIGIDGFRKESGFTGNDYMRSETVKDMAKQAQRVIVVTDSVKFDQQGLVKLIDTKAIDTVITDENIPQESESYLNELDVHIEKVI